MKAHQERKKEMKAHVLIQVKPGDRIKLLRMDNDPNPVKPGTCGTVREVCPWPNGETQVWVNWDNGRTGLAVVLPIDQIKVLPTKKAPKV